LVAVLYAAISANAMAADYEETVPAPADANLAEPAEIFNTSGALTAEPLSDVYCDACSSCYDGRFRSDREFDTFIEPISNPLWATDPRSITRARFVFLNQMIPGSSVIGKGDLQVYALEISVALNERWSIIAERDGYSTLQARGIPNDQGWADIAAGLKYVLHRDVCSQFIVSTGFQYELTQGTQGVFQGNGDGVWNPFLTAGKKLGCYHAIGVVGMHLPNNGNKESQSIFYSLHLDRQLTCRSYAVLEFNGINYTDSGNALAVNQEGGDFINLGANNVTGNNFATMAAGATVKLADDLTAAAAYEFPVMGRRDLFDNRFYFQMSVMY
jgi:hypothetical protein